jgi:enoyl-CoA hydratase/carnithine racemase
MSELIQVSRDAGTMTIRFNRPDKKNAFTVAMYESMAAALAEAERDQAVRVILFTAAGDAFTAGNDLGDFMSRPPTDESSPVFRFLAALASASKPLVAAVDGLGVGIGLTLLLHCDLVYATERTKLRAPFVDLGLVPEAASSLLLPRLFGYQRAAEILLLGETIDARRAYELGLVNAVVPQAELAARAQEACTKLAAKPPMALKLTKQLLKDPAHATVAERIRHEAVYFGRQLGSAEVKEAITAFFEKRTPDFTKLG